MSRTRGGPGCRLDTDTLAQFVLRTFAFLLLLPVLVWYRLTRRRSLTYVFNKLLHRATNQHVWFSPLLMWMNNGDLWACHYTATRLFASAVGQHPARIVSAMNDFYTMNAWISCGSRPLLIFVGWPARNPKHYHALYYLNGVMWHSAMFSPPATRGNESAGFPLRQDAVKRSRPALDRIANNAAYRVRQRDVELILFDIERILTCVPNLEALIDTSFYNNTRLINLDRTAEPDERVCLRWPD